MYLFLTIVCFVVCLAFGGPYAGILGFIFAHLTFRFLHKHEGR